MDYYINKAKDFIPDSLTTKILANSHPLNYHQQLSNYQPTPLLALRQLAKKYGIGNIYVKDESHRFGLQAFKGLGAAYAIHIINKEKPNIETFCSATDGNHGRAVAWSAQQLGKKSVIYVPSDTTQNRIKAIEKQGAKVIQLDKNYDETCLFAAEACQKNNWELIQDTAYENYQKIPALIMAGYLTMFKELEQSLHPSPVPTVDFVFLQAGVGSWAASAIWYYYQRYGKNRPQLIIVEPYESDGILASFQANQRVDATGNKQTIMAGLNCGIPSYSAWEIIKNGADYCLKVKDNFAIEAMQALYYPNNKDPKIIGGESGVGGLAGFLAVIQLEAFKSLKAALNMTSDSKVLFYNTEGATDLDAFNKAIGKTNSQNAY